MLENSASIPAKTSAPAKVLSVCVSLPKTVNYRGREVLTGIYKEPVQGKIALRTLNLDGDEQADLTVHGGVDKAVYVYSAEHYSFWREEFPDMKLDWGMFGENLTTKSLLETDVCIGDEFRVGTAIIRATQPRLPCYKLGIKFRRADIMKRFLVSGKSGIYFSVIEEGVLGVNDEIIHLSSDQHKVTVSEVAALFSEKKHDPAQIEKIMNSRLAPQMKMFVAGLQYGQ